MVTEFVNGPMDGVVKDTYVVNGVTKEYYTPEDIGRQVRQKVKLPTAEQAKKLDLDYSGSLLDPQYHYYHIYLVEKVATKPDKLFAVYAGWDRVLPNRGEF